MSENNTNTNYDELLDVFCRACLKKYEDPGDLFHYTEKNRRLFIYSTGIQVKHNDTFTFQICKHCHVNMKNSCKFKKQCRNSDRSLKNFLKMKELEDGIDLPTFLRNCDEGLKFPLCGHSTPATQKTRDDDNESTCTSIRNFMTDILQDEEMPDNEARIIKEVIEEEADLLDDSLDSYWLLDDTIDNESRLDFSFSPFVTPRSTEDHCFTLIKQIEPSLRCKNNHAQRVFQQLPTTNNDDNVKIQQYKSITQSNNVKTESDVKFIGTEDSIAELINQNEDFILSQREQDNDININTAFQTVPEVGNSPFINIEKEVAKSLHLETESKVNKTNFPLTENDIAVKSIILGLESQENRQTFAEQTDLPVKTIDLSTFETEFHADRHKSWTTENDVAVKSITLNTFGIKSEDANSEFENENDLSVRSISLNDFGTGSNQDMEDSTVTENMCAVKEIIPNSSASIRKEPRQMTENELAVKSILNIEPNAFDSTENDKAIEPMDYEIEHDIDRREFPKSETALAVKSIERAFESENQHDNHKISYITLNTVEIINKDAREDQNHERYAPVETMPVEDHNDDHLFDDGLAKDGDKNNQEVVEDYVVEKVIDENLETVSPLGSSDKITLEDLLDSPARVYAQGNGRIAGLSTPTINNILFGEKLEDDSNNPTTPIMLKTTDGEVDALEEFFKEGVKEFEGREFNPELPLELKYDLQNNFCKMCNRKFDKLRALQIHLGKKHHIRFPKKYVPTIKTCSLCGKNVDSKNYSRHIKKHEIDALKKGEYKCDICVLTFLGESHLKQHMSVHKPRSELKVSNKPKKYMCSTCGASFVNSGNLAVHNRRHTVDFSHICPTCGKGHHRRGDMEKHIRSNHTKEYPFKCPRCAKAFVTKYELGTHMRRNHIEKQFTCDHCDKKFSNKNELVPHMIKKHATLCKTVVKRRVMRPRPFKCSKCQRAFAKKFTLVKHQNFTACGEIEYSDSEENVSRTANDVTIFVSEEPESFLVSYKTNILV